MDADVLVLGAGAAGLAAARELSERSLRVVLLEARDRTGGRVRWEGVPGSSEPAELGAEFIHGRAKETMRLLHDFGLRTAPLGDESWVVGESGKLERDDHDFVSTAGALLEKAAALDDDESAAQFLRRFEHDPSLRETVATARAFVEGFEAADPAIASARAIADELRSGADETSVRPAGGYAPMFGFLHEACIDAGADVCLNAAVRRIAWRRGEIEVEVADPHGASQVVRARRAIVTLPIGVLRDGPNPSGVTFEPELPAWKRQALASIEMGHVAKVVLWFKQPFWEEVSNGRYRDSAFFRGVQQTFAAYWTLMPLRTRLVVAWAGGPRALALNAVSQSELIERACVEFGELLGDPEGARNQLEGGAMHDWGADPFARGAYSYVTVGGGDARAVLAAPIEDTLFFAGEATSIDGQGGTVNGALETGERAAGEVTSG
jgi:monoamine oxidase